MGAFAIDLVQVLARRLEFLVSSGAFITACGERAARFFDLSARFFIFIFQAGMFCLDRFKSFLRNTRFVLAAFALGEQTLLCGLQGTTALVQNRQFTADRFTVVVQVR